jgi:hypothetical protein
MVGIYKITNEENGNNVPYNETALLKVIKGLEGRNKPLQEYYIDLWENLHGRRFTKKHLELV